MSFLFPLYLLGLTAVGLPIAFHLLRKTPRGRQNFSSLLFLAPSPPRLTRRSKLDHLLLLALRALALILIALAFARPFQRLAAMLDMSAAAGHRYVVLVDTSASMQRGDLFEQAKAKTKEHLEALRPQDRIAMIAFDDAPRILTSFPDGESASKSDIGKTAALESLRRMSPSWRRTDIGSALTTAADILVAAKDENRTDERLEIILISDMQEGAALDALQAFEWPPGVALTVQTIHPKTLGNAAARVLPPEKNADPSEARVRVTAAEHTDQDRFTLTWENASGQVVGEPFEVYAPAGQTRVVRTTRPLDQPTTRLRLTGDGVDFDNIFHTTAAMKRTIRVACLGGDEPKDIKGSRYYLENAVADSPTRVVAYETHDVDKPFIAGEGDAAPDAVFVAAALNEQQMDELNGYAARGGRVLVASPADVDPAIFAKLLGQTALKAEHIKERDYAMFGRVDFGHPLFAAFSDPRFNDFTKIRFWNRLHLEVDDSAEDLKVLARFDDGDPLLLERTVGDGRIYVLATSWRPSESQLALSTKFVPLLTWLLDPRQSETLASDLEIGDVGRAPTHITSSSEPQVRTPAGDLVAIAENGRFPATDLPGPYQYVWPNAKVDFAVNVPARESATAAMDPGALEALGVQLGGSETIAAKLERERQMRDIELESQQVYWRWFLAAGLLLLIAETVVAGWQSRPAPEGITT